LARKPIPEGRLDNLFLDRSNTSRADKPLKSTQLVAQSDKPPSGSSRLFTDLQSTKAEIKEEIDVDDGESHDEIWETQDVGDGESWRKLYPHNDNLLTYFNCPIEERNCSFSISSASSSVKNSKSPIRSGNFSSCEHPEIFKLLRDFTLPMLSGRIFRLQHLFRFKKTRLVKFSID
jgi:hypothetical protein